MPKHSDDADKLTTAPRELSVSTAHPELRYRLDEALVADPKDVVDQAPVYRRTPGGETVVPSGRVFVRYDDQVSAADRAQDLAAAGYVIDEVPSYAANTAWVRATSGSIAEALHSIDGLSKLPGVAAVEPEMVGTRAKRA